MPCSSQTSNVKRQNVNGKMLLCKGPRPVPGLEAAEPGTRDQPPAASASVLQTLSDFIRGSAEHRLGIFNTPIRLAQVAVQKNKSTRTGCR